MVTPSPLPSNSTISTPPDDIMGAGNGYLPSSMLNGKDEKSREQTDADLARKRLQDSSWADVGFSTRPSPRTTVC